MDAIGTGGEGRPAKVDIVVLADGEDRSARGMRRRDGDKPVVDAGGQVDHDPVDIRQHRFERDERPDRLRLSARATDEVRQSCRPDQVVGEDGDARGQSSASAR